jgi:hypothetical protein
MNNIQAITTFMSVSTKRKLKESHFPLDRKTKTDQILSDQFID